MTTEFKGDADQHSHIDWRHGPLSFVKDHAMSDEQFNILLTAINGLTEGQRILSDMIDALNPNSGVAAAIEEMQSLHATGIGEKQPDPPADPKPEIKPKVTALKPKAAPKAHAKS